ncbi:MAG: hypothetical protein COV51_04750 [Gallionellaceae bacterium CG11_big_fil_rev_8_21_14_0_20_60_62]|nr:MAG: hypothetical protein COV51_04750 [Gallionellaceae bacterium CG11_big_fil_rev_8_21_14_0_20_60_62]PIV47615.1 MAG: hypothetical protein COS20_03840 [Gallionellaceae bacterium CG02_land_8_20_14_3_00_60_115]
MLLGFEEDLLYASSRPARNRLFADNERAGKRAPAIQSLFATAKLNGIEQNRSSSDCLQR